MHHPDSADGALTVDSGGLVQKKISLEHGNMNVDIHIANSLGQLHRFSFFLFVKIVLLFYRVHRNNMFFII